MSSGSSRHKDVKRIAGRGTWTTPAYVPPWAANGTDTVLDKGRFGPKRGKNRYLFTCFQLGKKLFPKVSEKFGILFILA